MYRIHDNGTIEIVRGDTAYFKIIPQYFDIVENPEDEDLPSYYEFIDGEYIPTEDKYVDPKKTYYDLHDYELQDGDTLLFTVKRNAKRPEVIFQKTGPMIHIESEDTEGLKYRTYKYDVQYSNSNGDVDTIIRPTDFKVSEEVTW